MIFSKEHYFIFLTSLWLVYTYLFLRQYCLSAFAASLHSMEWECWESAVIFLSFQTYFTFTIQDKICYDYNSNVRYCRYVFERWQNSQLRGRRMCWALGTSEATSADCSHTLWPFPSPPTHFYETLLLSAFFAILIFLFQRAFIKYENMNWHPNTLQKKLNSNQAFSNNQLLQIRSCLFRIWGKF